MFEPQKGYRDLRFGMSPVEVEKVLGPPTEEVNEWERFDYDEEELEMLMGRIGRAYNGYPPFHEKIDLEFKDDRLVSIYLQEAKQPVMIGDLDLYQKDRRAVMERLFELDKELYGTRSDAFFGNLGLIVAWPKKWKQTPVVEMVESEDFFESLAFQTYEDLDELL